MNRVKKIYPFGLIALIFALGTAFILYPSVGNLVTLGTASISISEYEDKVETLADDGTQAKLLETARAYNQHLYYGTQTEGEEECLGGDGAILGYLEIPSIRVYLPVYYGTSDEVLQKGVGFLEQTSLPVGGENSHTALSGHTGLPGAELLSSLDQMEEGDLFYIHILGETLAYEVDQITVVKPEETDGLKIEPGKDLATLITCTPYGVNTDRLLVRGVRTEYVPAAEDEETGGTVQTVKRGLSRVMVRQAAIILAILLAAVTTAVAAEIYRRKSLPAAKESAADAAKPEEKSRAAEPAAGTAQREYTAGAKP